METCSLSELRSTIADIKENAVVGDDRDISLDVSLAGLISDVP